MIWFVIISFFHYLTLRAAGVGGSCLVKLCKHAVLRSAPEVLEADDVAAASSSDEPDFVSCRSATAAAAAAMATVVFACFLLSLAILSGAWRSFECSKCLPFTSLENRGQKKTRKFFISPSTLALEKGAQKIRFEE